jgi:AraC family transcriptional regulator
MASAESVRLQAGTFYGRKTRALEVAGFRLTESCYQPGSALPPHSHEQAHFIAVLSGRYAETIGRTRAQRTPGSTLFLPSDIPHEERHHAAGRHFMVEIRSEMLGRWRERPGDFTCAVDLPPGKAAHVTRRLYQEFREQEESSALVIEGLVLLLLTLTTERRESDHRDPPGFLQQARQFIHDQIGVSFTIEQLAESVGVNRWQLTRAFQKHCHCTPGEYLRRDRFALLLHPPPRPGRSLAEVAQEAGFSDQSHFSRAFKSCTGVTPRWYQQQLRRESSSRA